MREQVLEHLTRYFGTGRQIYKNIEGTPLVDLYLFPANEDREFHTLATLGLSDQQLNATPGFEEYSRQEFLMYLPKHWEMNLNKRDLPSTWACMFLFFAARHALDKTVFLHPGSVLHTENTRHPTFFRYPYAVLMPPLGEKPEFYPLQRNGTTVNFCVPVFITEAEADFQKKNGFKALVDAMMKRDVIQHAFVSDPLRPCTFGPSAAEEEVEKEFRGRVFDMVERDEAVRAHYEKHFGKPSEVREEEIAGSGGKHTNRLLNLLAYPPTADRPFYTLATRGISDKPFSLKPVAAEYNRHELLIYLPPDSKPNLKGHWASNLLIHLALYAFKGNNLHPFFALRNGNPPEPWMPNSALVAALLTGPMFETKEFNSFEYEGAPIRFCQVVPISKQELAMVESKKITDLLRQMEKAGTLEQISAMMRPCTFDVLSSGVARKPGFRLRPPEFNPLVSGKKKGCLPLLMLCPLVFFVFFVVARACIS